MATSRLLTVLGQALAYVAPHAFRVVAIMTAEDSSGFLAWPTVTAGTGVPDEAQPNGSKYFRTDGSWYRRVGSAWVKQVQATTEALGVPAAKGTTNVHAGHAGNNVGAAFTVSGAITNPDRPRNVRVTFDASWDGGNVTVSGTDPLTGAAVSEVFAPGAGTTVVGVKIFATITSITKAAVGASATTATVGTGDKLGFTAPLASPVGVVAVDGVTEVGTWDAIYSAVTPTTAPNGARVYTAFYTRP